MKNNPDKSYRVSTQESLHGCFSAIAVELSGQDQQELEIEDLVQYCKDQVSQSLV